MFHGRFAFVGVSVKRHGFQITHNNCRAGADFRNKFVELDFYVVESVFFKRARYGYAIFVIKSAEQHSAVHISYAGIFDKQVLVAFPL